MRLFSASFAHESSSFSPIPTNLENFRAAMLHRPSHGEIVPPRFKSIECGITALATQRGHDVVESVSAVATPSGPMVRADYESVRDEIIADLRNAMPVDAVALFLHGAQLAQGYDDPEGDLLSAIRQIVGPDVPVGVEFDLHGNVTPTMLQAATVLLACKEYPHTDFPERAVQLLDILEAAVAGRAKPVRASQSVPVMGIFHTTRQPLRGLVDRISEMEQSPDVLGISIAHGFPWTDTQFVGATIIVVTNNDAALAEKLAAQIAAEFYAMRETIAVPLTTIDDALNQYATNTNGLTIIADTADNAGGGAASDATFFLREISRRKLEHVALGMLWDPVAVSFAFAAGVGATLPMRIGGKTGVQSGDPFDTEVTVTALNPKLRQIAFGHSQSLGKAAAVRTACGIDVVLAAEREQTHSPECFTDMGIDLGTKRLTVVKSAQHFHARFNPIASRIIYAVGPGATSIDFSTFNYTRLRRPVWPLDEMQPFTPKPIVWRA